MYTRQYITSNGHVDVVKLLLEDSYYAIQYFAERYDG